MLVTGAILLGWKSLQVYKGRLISLYGDEARRERMEGRCSRLPRLESCCLLTFPARRLCRLLMGHGHGTPASAGSPHWLVPITACPSSAAWPVFWFCVPTPLQGGLESSPACSQAIPDVRQLGQPRALWKVLRHSYTFSPLFLSLPLLFWEHPLKGDL